MRVSPSPKFVMGVKISKDINDWVYKTTHKDSSHFTFLLDTSPIIMNKNEALHIAGMVLGSQYDYVILNDVLCASLKK